MYEIMLMKMGNVLLLLRMICLLNLLVLSGGSETWQIDAKDLKCAADDEPSYHHGNIEPESRIEEPR